MTNWIIKIYIVSKSRCKLQRLFYNSLKILKNVLKVNRKYQPNIIVVRSFHIEKNVE